MNKDAQLIHQLKQAVLDNLENEQFGVEYLAQFVGVSRSHLHRRLKMLKGQSISQFIREIRLEKAMELLRQDVATTSEIAYRVGFQSPSYFHKCFLELYGYPPGEVKHLFQNQSENVDLEMNSEVDHSVNSNLTGESLLLKSRKRKRNISVNVKTIAVYVSILVLIAFSVFYFFQEEFLSTPVEKSIAVLPFNSLSTDEENRHFADGLVEDLLNRLVTVKEFKVISRTSSDTYRERGKKTVPEIASKLGVSYVVEGSVQKYGNKARITVQLIDAIKDDHIWVESFDVDVADIFEIQSEIAMQVASHISTVLTEQQSIDIRKNRTESVKAFELYQLGRFYWGKRIQQEYKKAIYYFEQAIVEDPNYALAYAGLADTYFLITWGLKESGEVLKYRNKAEENALKALALDERLVEAHTVLATLDFFIDWDWATAEKRFLQAFDLNPNYSTLHHRYSEHLSSTGRHVEARKHINKAIELDPLSFIVRSVSAKLYLNRGAFKEALSEVKISEELNKESFRPAWYKLLINYKLGNERVALENLKKLETTTENPFPYEMVDSIYKLNGMEYLLRWKIQFNDSIYNSSDLENNQSVARGLEINHSPNSHLHKAKLYAYLGDNEKAMDWLELAFSEGNRMPEVSYWYSTNNLQSNARFIALMKKMNLPWSPTPSK